MDDFIHSLFLSDTAFARYRYSPSLPFFRMFFFSKKKNPHETACLVCHIIISVLLLLASVAALTGIVMAHQDARGLLLFGTNAGSLSLIAFALCVTLWMKSLKACMSSCEACEVVKKK